MKLAQQIDVHALETLNKDFEDKKLQRKKLGQEMQALWEVYAKAKDDWKLIDD